MAKKRTKLKYTWRMKRDRPHGSRRFTDEQVARMCELRRAPYHKTWPAIGAEFGISGKEAWKQCVQYGDIDEANERPRALVTTFNWDFSRENLAI